MEQRICSEEECERPAPAKRRKCHRCQKRSERQAKRQFKQHDDPHEVPGNYVIKGVSNYWRIDPKTGERTLVGQWTKSAREQQDKLAIISAAFEDVQVNPIPRIERVLPEQPAADDLLAVIPIGDPHIGMYSWAAETGADFDTTIAREDLATAFDQLYHLAKTHRQGVPSRCLIANMGDFFHADNGRNTTTLGTAVDVDTRQAKVIDVGLAVMFYGIDRALEIFDIVDVWSLIGNHDGVSSLFLARCLAARYHDNPRVRINTTPSRAAWLRFGDVLLGGTHGDTIKPDRLLGVMVSDRKRDFGETEYHHWYTGHVHHDSYRKREKDGGMTYETVRTLAPKDAWHAGQGYRSGQDIKLDIWHAKFGRQVRYTVPIQQIHHLQRSKKDEQTH